MELNNNQAALILSTSDDGEITMDVESPDMNGLASSLCHALAKKLMRDEDAASAFLALSAHAGYAQLAPAGFSTSSGGFTYAAAANDRVYGKVIHQAGALLPTSAGKL